MGNPYLGIPTFTEALEQDLMSQRPPPGAYLPFPMRPGMSLGGGGPGPSPISTDPPLSLEATGASLAQLGKPGGPASSSKRRSRPRRYALPIDSSEAFGKHNPCDKGYHPRKIKGRWYCVRK